MLLSTLVPDENLWIDVVERFLSITLFRSGDDWVTVGQLLVAVLVGFFGLWFASHLARRVAKHLTKTRDLDKMSALSVQKLILWGLVPLIGLLSLSLSGIPMTALTVVSGGVAIAVGFGAQALFNNIISGFIILVERPLSIGDLIECNGTQGKVIEIGARCTKIRQANGVTLLVPNSHFIEKPVVNWTHSERQVRGEIDVGVNFGADTALVQRLLLQAASEHGRVLSAPLPDAFFERFGDSALHFKLYFWTEVEFPRDLLAVSSDLRLRIDALLRENGVSLAHPQRDLHIKSAEASLLVQLAQERGA